MTKTKPFAMTPTKRDPFVSHFNSLSNQYLERISIYDVSVSAGYTSIWTTNAGVGLHTDAAIRIG